MSEEVRERECPSCHGRYLRHGKYGESKSRFKPEEQRMWMGYEVKIFACLECGFLGHYLKESDILDLRSKQPSSYLSRTP